jgi:hypothetical protein
VPTPNEAALGRQDTAYYSLWMNDGHCWIKAAMKAEAAKTEGMTADPFGAALVGWPCPTTNGGKGPRT